MIENPRFNHSKLNSLTCLALGKVAHLEDVLEIGINQAELLLSDISMQSKLLEAEKSPATKIENA